MSHAQKILMASHMMLRLLREAKIALDEPFYREYCRRVERWCAEAEVKSLSSS